jgi:hypothetical protein
MAKAFWLSILDTLPHPSSASPTATDTAPVFRLSCTPLSFLAELLVDGLRLGFDSFGYRGDFIQACGN